MNIDTNEKVDCPTIGSIIEIDSMDYEVVSRKYSFLNEGDFVIFTSIVGLVNAKTKQEIDQREKREIEQREKDLAYERLMELIR